MSIKQSKRDGHKDNENNNINEVKHKHKHIVGRVILAIIALLIITTTEPFIVNIYLPQEAAKAGSTTAIVEFSVRGKDYWSKDYWSFGGGGIWDYRVKFANGIELGLKTAVNLGIISAKSLDKFNIGVSSETLRESTSGFAWAD